MAFKVNRKVKFENLKKDKAEKKMKQTDKERAEYYNHFTSQIWGNRDNYDLCIDTSKLGVVETIDFIEEYVRKRIKKKN